MVSRKFGVVTAPRLGGRGFTRIFAEKVPGGGQKLRMLCRPLWSLRCYTGALLHRRTWRRHGHRRSQETAHRYPVLRETSQGRVLLRRQDTPAASAGRGGRLLLPLAPAALRQEPAAGYPGLPLRGARGAVPRARSEERRVGKER